MYDEFPPNEMYLSTLTPRGDVKTKMSSLRGSGHCETNNKLLEDAVPASGAGVKLFEALTFSRIEEVNTDADISLGRVVDHGTLAKHLLVRNNNMLAALGMPPQHDYVAPRLHLPDGRLVSKASPMLCDYHFHSKEKEAMIMQNYDNKVGRCRLTPR